MKNGELIGKVHNSVSVIISNGRKICSFCLYSNLKRKVGAEINHKSKIYKKFTIRKIALIVKILFLWYDMSKRKDLSAIRV